MFVAQHKRPTHVLSPAFPFVLEVVDAANQIVTLICQDLQNLVGLRYAPAKYWLRVVYATVVLIKAACTHASFV